MKKIMKTACLTILALAIAAAQIAPALAATKYDAALNKWTRTYQRRDDLGSTFIIKATIYTSEYIENLMASEAEKNLWTQSELEDYKYNFLKDLNMGERLPIYLEIEELGPTAHMNPFEEMLFLWIGNKKYEMVDYDRRFNMPLQGKRDGLVFFPRRDEKTGESLFKKKTNLRLSLVAGATPIINSEIRLLWDVSVAEMEGEIIGSASNRLEIDRLIRRIEKLASEKSDLESQLSTLNREIEEVNKRIDELRSN